MKKKDLFLFFLLPFVGFVAILLAFSLLNRSFIQRKTVELVRGQLTASAEILRVNVSHFLEDGMAPQDVLRLYAGEKNIYYMALLDGRGDILAWSSRYEGYLPFSKDDERRTEPWILASPAGSIANLFVPVTPGGGRAYSLYLGYSLAGFDEMLARSSRTFFLLFGILAAAGVLFFTGLFVLQRRYLDKAREAEEEKREKERFREISAFTSGVAHEIKNPLNSLALLCEIMLKKGSAEVREDASLGKTEVQRIARVIDRFSAALRPIRPVRRSVAVREVVEAARKSLGETAAGPGVAFRYEETEPIVIEADPDLLAQGLANLVRNAFEATEVGTVTVSAKRQRRRIVVSIADTGRGLGPEEIERVFEPFFTTKATGMGVGLYLARKIVEAHGGKIWLESEPGRGTRFFVEIAEEGHD